MRLNTKNGLFLKVAIVILFMNFLNAEETININSNELYSFTVQKYKVDFDAQTEKSKKDILNEYLQTVKLSDTILESDFKDNVDLKVANRILIVNLWAQKIMNDAKISDETLQKLFKKHSPKIEPKYQIRNILLKNETEAKKIEKSLKKLKGAERLDEFKKLVKSDSEDFTTRKQEGSLGWIDENNLIPAIKDALKGKNLNDVVKVNIENIGWQVLLLEDFQPAKNATFEESKEILTKLAKQEILSKKIESILK